MLALNCGIDAARTVSGPPDEMATRLGVRVEDVEADGGFGNVMVFADYRPRPPSVRLYAPALRVLDAELPAYPEPLPGSRAVFLAHELFHHLETLDPRCVPSRRHRSKALSEIAAGAFAQELLGLRYHPKLLDVAALFSRDPATAERLADDICEMGRERHDG